MAAFVTVRSAARVGADGPRAWQRVLANPNNWLVHTMALLLKSRLESDKGRTVERAALQLQALVDQYGDTSPEAAASLRLQYFFLLSVRACAARRRPR